MRLTVKLSVSVLMHFCAKRLRGDAIRLKPATLATWESCLAKYLNPAIGELPLISITNGALKQLVASLDKSGLGARAIQLYTGFMKLVIASAVDPDSGEQLYPRKWNHEFADMPIVHDQKQPTLTERTMSSIAKEPRGKDQALFSLLGAIGMRIGEALGLNISNINVETRVIEITQSAWRSDIQLPKTGAAIREIDITAAVAEMLKTFIGDHARAISAVVTMPQWCFGGKTMNVRSSP